MFFVIWQVVGTHAFYKFLFLTLVSSSFSDLLDLPEYWVTVFVHQYLICRDHIHKAVDLIIQSGAVVKVFFTQNWCSVKLKEKKKVSFLN